MSAGETSFRFGVRFLARENADKTLTVVNPALLPTALPATGIIGLHGRASLGVFTREVRAGRERGEFLHAIMAYYTDNTAESPTFGRVTFDATDYPARRWLDLRYMRRSLSDIVLPLLNIPSTVGTALVRESANDNRLAMSLSPMFIERALPFLNEALGVSLDMIVTPFFPPGSGSSPPACVWVINPRCLSPLEAEDETFTINPLPG